MTALKTPFETPLTTAPDRNIFAFLSRREGITPPRKPGFGSNA
ncbi:MAG TPA: hypothetical protein VMW03_04350 [Candidatus Krumholzibacteriaceae bacterium]|nr:hypothetical protein [Candidatus Krumholzibacteriaceae bacterium]